MSIHTSCISYNTYSYNILYIMDTIIFTIYSTNLQDKSIFLIEQQLLMQYGFSHVCVVFTGFIYMRNIYIDIISMVAIIFCLLFEEQCVLYVCICLSKKKYIWWELILHDSFIDMRDIQATMEFSQWNDGIWLVYFVQNE